MLGRVLQGMTQHGYTSPMRVGLMGGTFDPPHIGHLFIAEEARVRCNLDFVVFFPNFRPAHREGKSANASPQDRWELTLAAIADNPHFRASRVELDRPGPSYAFDTLHVFRDEYGSNVELFFIVGGDSIRDVLTWHRGAELFSLCRFIAFARPGFNFEEAQVQLSHEQRTRVEWLSAPQLDIASRDIRRRVAQGWPIRYLVPMQVEREIRAKRLYTR